MKSWVRATGQDVFQELSSRDPSDKVSQPGYLRYDLPSVLTETTTVQTIQKMQTPFCKSLILQMIVHCSTLNNFY
jgi:hypothetical protein